MTKTYKATGINLKGIPLGENDRILTVLTSQWGLIRLVAPGARKYKSTLRGRSELFVVNELLIAKGRSLDKIIQAETIETYPGLSSNLDKLATSQYLAEIVLGIALSDQPQTELYQLFKEHIRRLSLLQNSESALPPLTQAIFHLLALAGIGPQVHKCCLTQEALTPNFTKRNWQVGFSFGGGGIVNLLAKNSLHQDLEKPQNTKANNIDNTTSNTTSNTTKLERQKTPNQNIIINTKIGPIELSLLQYLGGKSLPIPSQILPLESIDLSLDSAWINLEQLLRNYTQYHLGKSFRSPTLYHSIH